MLFAVFQITLLDDFYRAIKTNEINMHINVPGTSKSLGRCIEVSYGSMNDIDEVTEMLFQNVFKQYELQLDLLNNLIRHYERP